MKAVQIQEWGGAPVVVEAPEPHAGPGQVRVKVSATSVNPADVMLGANEQFGKMFGLSLPVGFNNDFAGTVDEAGEGVTGFAVGDRVFGGARARALAEYVVVTPQAAGAPRTPGGDELYHTPDTVTDEAASTFQTAGLTAEAALEAIDVKKGDTVLIGGAAGGVGTFAVQIAVAAGARVIGTAGQSTFEYLRALGAEPITYGDGLVERVRAVAPDGITSATDLFGTEAAEAALELGVPGERISTIASQDPGLAQKVHGTGSLQATPGAMDHLAQLTAEGKVTVPIAATFTIDKVAEASALMMQRHVHGKIIVTP